MNILNHLVDRAMFPGTRSSYDAGSFEELIWIPMKNDPYKIPCVLIPYQRGSPYLIIYAHGNGTDIGDIIQRLENLTLAVQAHIISFDYPGYGCFDGNADMVLVDKIMDTIVDFAENVLFWPLENIVLFGCSIGTGPCTRFARNVALNGKKEKTSLTATSSAPSHVFLSTDASQPVSREAERRLGGLILQCPYRSIRHAAEKFIGGFMSRIFVETRWNIEDEVFECSCPILWIHVGFLNELQFFITTLGKKDELFDWRGSEEMFNKYANPQKMLQTPESATHLTFDFYDDIVRPVRRFLKNMVSPHSRTLPYFSCSFGLCSGNVKPPPISCPIPICPGTFATHINDFHKSPNSFHSQHMKNRALNESTASSPPILSSNTSSTTFENISQETATYKQADSSFESKMNHAKQHSPIAGAPDSRTPITSTGSLQHQNHLTKESLPLPSEKKRSQKNDQTLRVGYDFSLLKHVWPLESLRLYIQKSIVALAFAILRETIRQGFHKLVHEPLYKAVDWVRRFYCVRCRHVLGVELIYEKSRNDTENGYNIFGVVIAGRLLRLPSFKEVRGCVFIEGLPPILGYQPMGGLSTTFLDSIYTSSDYLILPVFSPKADFIFCLTSWLMSTLSKLLDTQMALTDLDYTTFLQSVIRGEDDIKTLENMSETFLYDFCMQSRRPHIERLIFHLGNYICFGWDQLISIIFNYDWAWFEPRVCLSTAVSHSSTKTFHANRNANSRKCNPKKTVRRDTPHFIRAEGWNMLRNWCSNSALCHGIHLKTLTTLRLEKTRNPPYNPHQTLRTSSLNAPSRSSSDVLYRTMATPRIRYTAVSSRPLAVIPHSCLSPRQQTTDPITVHRTPELHDEITDQALSCSKEIKQEVIHWIMHLARCLKAAVLPHALFNLPDPAQSKLQHHELHARNIYMYFFNLYSLGNMSMKRSNTTADTSALQSAQWARQMVNVLIHDPKLYCNPSLHILNSEAYISTATRTIEFLLSCCEVEHLTPAMCGENEAFFRADRLAYIKRCREHDERTSRDPLRYSICYHHLFHHILMQPGRYTPKSFIVALDSLWRLVEVMTGLQSGPSFQPLSVESNSGPYATAAPTPLPTVEQACTMINLTVALALLRGLYALTLEASEKIAAKSLTQQASLKCYPVEEYPGVQYSVVRLFDEIRFTLQAPVKQVNLYEKPWMPPPSGYPVYVSGWDSGCYETVQHCLLAAELEQLYSSCTEVLSALDLNTISKADANRQTLHTVKDFEDSSTPDCDPKDVLFFSNNSLQDVSSDKKNSGCWWLEGFSWVAHPVMTEPKPMINMDVSTTASSKIDLFESPVSSVQSSRDASENGFVIIASSDTEPEKPKNINHSARWLASHTKLKTRRKTHGRHLLGSIRQLITSSPQSKRKCDSC